MSHAGASGRSDAVTDVDPHEIMRELGFSAAYRATVLAQNRGKAVWRMDRDGETFALRMLRPDHEQTALWEQRAMSFAGATGVPTPQVLAAAVWQRRPAMLLSWCEGQTLRESLRARPWAAFGLGMACGREQARLHRQPAPTAFGAPSWIARFGDVDPELRARLERVESAHTALLHLDCHGDNILLASGEVTGVVDWTNACVGDPRADVARTWSMLTRWAGAGVRGRAAAYASRIAAAGWLRGYEQVAGTQRDMLLFRIWALTALVGTSRAEAASAGTDCDLTALEGRLARLRRRSGLAPAEG